MNQRLSMNPPVILLTKSSHDDLNPAPTNGNSRNLGVTNSCSRSTLRYIKYSAEQVEALEVLYHHCPKPSSVARLQLIRDNPLLHNIHPQQIKVWFQNRRYILYSTFPAERGPHIPYIHTYIHMSTHIHTYIHTFIDTCMHVHRTCSLHMHIISCHVMSCHIRSDQIIHRIHTYIHSVNLSK